MIRGIISTVVSLAVFAIVYFVFIEPNIDDAKDAIDSATQTEPSKGGKPRRSNGERFARCVQRDPTNVDHIKACRERHLK